MVSTPQSQFSGFSADVLEALLRPSIAERWAAVQAQLHPQLVALAEVLRDAGMRRFPREWPLYEFSFRSLRYINHPDGRAPIDNYYMGLTAHRVAAASISWSAAPSARSSWRSSFHPAAQNRSRAGSGSRATRSCCRWSSASTMCASPSSADDQQKKEIRDREIRR